MTGVTYKEVECKSALNRVNTDVFGFRWSLNVYRGCRHACPYCYARVTHEYLGFENLEDFDRVIQVKTNIADVLRTEILTPSWGREYVAVGTATDNYQPAERRYKLTRRCLELLQRSHTPFGIVTKSNLVLRDLDILEAANTDGYASVGFTLNTLDESRRRFLEPGAQPVEHRLEAIRACRSAGIPVGLLIQPIVPHLTDDEATLHELMRTAAELEVDWVGTSVMRLPKGVKSFYLERLKRFDISRYYATLRLYRNRYAEPSPIYLERLQDRLSHLIRTYGLKEWSAHKHPQTTRRHQLDLFEAEAS